jgi:hypothetical protein
MTSAFDFIYIQKALNPLQIGVIYAKMKEDSLPLRQKTEFRWSDIHFNRPKPFKKEIKRKNEKKQNSKRKEKNGKNTLAF